MNETFDAIIIGTGQAGPPLAKRLADSGMRVAIAERHLFGGTCVNTGCIPTKTLVASAYVAHMVRRAADFGVTTGGVGVDMKRVKARKDEVSACPFCGAVLDTLPKPSSDNAPRPVQCKKCWEYSGVRKGSVSPYNPNTVEERPTFRSPLAQSLIWPRGCVQCGAEPTRFEEVSTSSLNAGFLVVGALRVKTFKMSGVPYCNAHKKAVELSKGTGDKLYLDWRSLGMMRRYLAANRGRFAE